MGPRRWSMMWNPLAVRVATSDMWQLLERISDVARFNRTAGVNSTRITFFFPSFRTRDFSYTTPPPPPPQSSPSPSESHGVAGDGSFPRVRTIAGDGTVPVRAASGRQAAHRRKVPGAILPPQPTRGCAAPCPSPRSRLTSLTRPCYCCYS